MEAFVCSVYSDAKEDQFTIPDIDAKVLDMILKYMYTNNISLTEEDVSGVLLVSNRLLVYDLISTSQDFVARNLKIANCLSFFIKACEISNSTLINTCYRCVKVNFEQVILKSGHTVGDITFEDLTQFLEDGNLNVSSETVKWMAVVRWVEKKQLERLTFVPNLVNCYSEELDADVKIEILTHPLVKDNLYYEDYNSNYNNKSACLKYPDEEEIAARNTNIGNGLWPFNATFEMSPNRPL